MAERIFYTWSGQWENQIRAKKRLEIIIPIVFIIIFVMLYFTFKKFSEAGLVMLSVPFALIKEYITCQYLI
ncbi:MAG: efflux RND transporter permease subunit [Ignavibacteria bacterium]|nr:efflux RND transporter permease subunit [Ignavibacteria bacterium]